VGPATAAGVPNTAFRKHATIADALRFLLSVKQEFTAEHYKYDEFMQIMGEFGRSRSVTVIAFYLLASQLADC
jgi:histone deacetylase complex regulatory component SIN3